jgi:hypothetical protein
LANDAQFEIFFEQIEYSALGKKEKDALQTRHNEGVLAYLGEALTL